MVRYGVIGAGMMGVEHIGNINVIDDAEVVAVADPHRPSLDHAAERTAGRSPDLFTDHHALIDSGLCDAVVVATPNVTHVDIVADLLASDLHILIEKPLCTTVADCQKLVDLAAERAEVLPGRVVWVGLEYRYMPPVDRLRHEVSAGEVGTPRMVAIREHRFPFLDKVGNWNRFNENTGGTLVEKCCHFFDLMNLLVGERPQRVMASGAQDVNHLDERYDGRVPDILDNAFVLVDYPGGARAMLDLCMFADATHNQEEVSVVGERGKLEAFLPSNTLRRGRRGEHWIGRVETESVREPEIVFEGLHHGSSFVEHLRFLAAVRGEGSVEVTLEDGLWSVAVGVAAQRSIDEGRAVDLSEVLR